MSELLRLPAQEPETFTKQVRVVSAEFGLSLNLVRC